MRTTEELVEIREELAGMLEMCEAPIPEPLWQLSDWCITMQSIIDIDFQLLVLAHDIPDPAGSQQIS